jgi:hypothetical protein
MALPAQDPILAVHQVLGVLAYEELEPMDRSALEWARDRLEAVRANPTPAAWLAWYRESLSLIGQLTARSQARREEAVTATAPPSSASNSFAVGRVKEAGGAFLQRWQVRLQDQTTTLKQRFTADSDNVSISIQETDTALIFTVSDDEQTRFGAYVAATLNEWSTHVEASLVPSWRQHVRELLHAERLAAGPVPPPNWNVPPLTSSTPLAPNLAPLSTRRMSKGMALLRAVRDGNPLSIAVNIATLGLSLRNLNQEAARAVDEQCHRMHAAVSTWAGTAVDAHRTRMQTLLSGAQADARARLSEWADAAWPVRSALVTSRPSSPDMVPWASTLGMAKSAIATRIAQLEFEISGSKGKT